MRQVLAILGDSFREAIDRRVLIVLLGLSLIPILACFSLSFRSEPLDEILGKQAAELTTFRFVIGDGSNRSRRTRRNPDAKVEVGAVRPVDDADGFDAALRGGHVVALAFPDAAALDELAVGWFRFQADPFGRRRRAADGATPDEAGQADADDVPDTIEGAPRAVRFLEQRVADFGYQHVEARVDGAEALVAVRAEYPHEVRGAHELSLGFGLLTIPIPGISVAELVLTIQQVLAGILVGSLGMLIALFATASFVPNMLQKGTLDLCLARPISRTRLLLTKWAGGLWFVFVIAAFLVTGCWLGFVAGSGYASPWFLASILTLTTSFAVLYSVAVLVGVVTRSSGLSALAAIGVWWISSTLVSLRHGVHNPDIPFDAPGWVTTALEVAYAVLPKVKDFDYLQTLALSQAHLSDTARQRLFANGMPDIDWAFSLGTTAAFVAVVLGLAAWLFRRRDY